MKTIEEIVAKYGKSFETVRRNFDKLPICNIFQDSSPKSINLIFDGVYFGRSLCYIVCRAGGKTIYYRECPETIENIGIVLDELESMGYEFRSVTVDGRKGVKEYLKWRYPNVPLQHCVFHQKAAIKRYLTASPKTECGQCLKMLMEKLTDMDMASFDTELKALKERFADFLRERNENGRFVHRRLRSAFRSITENLPDLFTWKENPGLNIPNTTNSCEGYFRQIKSKIRVHPGLKKERLKKVIARLFSGC